MPIPPNGGDGKRELAERMGEASDDEVLELALSEKELAYVEHYARYRNQTQAYTHAYDTSGDYRTRATGGYQVFHRPHVQAALRLRLAEATERSGADIGWLLQRFLDIATADPRELIGLKVGCCRYCYGEGHAYQWRTREYAEACERVDKEVARLERMPPLMRLKTGSPEPDTIGYPDVSGGLDFNATLPALPDCPECHGEGLERFVPRDTDQLSDQALLLYGGVKAKRDGYEIIMASREKALENVGRIMGAFDDKLRIDASVKGLVAIGDIRNMEPQEAARVYQDFIKGSIAAS